jgi:hypothetical protein
MAVPGMLTQASLLEFWKVIWAVLGVLKVLEFLRVLVGEEEEVRPTRLAVAMLRDTISTFERGAVRRHDLRLSVTGIDL